MGMFEYWNDELELVDQFEGDWGYNWWAVGIFRRKSDGAMFWAEDEGCSCDSAWEGRAEDLDLKPCKKEQVLKFMDACKDLPELDRYRRWTLRNLDKFEPHITRDKKGYVYIPIPDKEAP